MKINNILQKNVSNNWFLKTLGGEGEKIESVQAQISNIS